MKENNDNEANEEQLLKNISLHLNFLNDKFKIYENLELERKNLKESTKEKVEESKSEVYDKQ